MDTIANECKVIENVGNNQTNSEKKRFRSWRKRS